MKKAGPPPTRVTPWRANNAVVSAGSNVSAITRVHPELSDTDRLDTPPMWAKGKASPNLSSAVTCWRSTMAIPDAITDESQWRAPLGFDVVPDV